MPGGVYAFLVEPAASSGDGVSCGFWLCSVRTPWYLAPARAGAFVFTVIHSAAVEQFEIARQQPRFEVVYLRRA
jgi:hypothetical protein